MRNAPVGTLGHAIQRARFTLGMTQRDLAKKLGLRRGYTVSRWEGGRHAPMKSLHKRVAALLGVAPAPHGANVLRALGLERTSEVASLRTALAEAVNRHADLLDAGPKRIRAAVREALEVAERHGVSA
jgi:transcriptional regulator with XRE-family HTH domain